MDPVSFGIVKGEVQRLPFKDDKVKAIAYAQGYLYAEQVGELMREFSCDDDRLKGLQACVGKMLPASCVGIFTILKAFNLDKNKVQALELVAVQVTDPLNYIVFNDVFPFVNDRARARVIMQRRATMAPPQAPVMNPAMAGNPYPYGRPKAAVDPNDPVYRAVDNAVTGVCSVVDSACGALFGRPSRPGAVIQRPVTYQTTTTAYVTPPGSGVQVLHVPQGATVQTIPTVAPVYQPYPYQVVQGHLPGTYTVGQAPPPYQPRAGYQAYPAYPAQQWK
ncbi:protein of unknown function (DUF4476) [Desmophyllum pertusum]|uniref:DUF4476 domain-containing protein n=1 Tax=Desmophyllum pertusum TaxID=174260 RepID=A0A9W9YWS9_9CNID|nr:protein of unknown function (DUF4476) [Desmophyllum pertusum]